MVEGWFARNASSLKVVFRAVFGVLWVIAGALKFQPGLVDQFPGMISADGQPSWLQGWFTFWAAQAASNAAFWVYLTGTLELAVGIGLIFGLMRKVAYLGGAVLSLFIWAVPEGFGGPYQLGVSTDLGGGIVYAMAFMMLIVINATYGPSKLSLDYWIEKHFPAWAKIAEFRRDAPADAPFGSSPKEPRPSVKSPG